MPFRRRRERDVDFPDDTISETAEPITNTVSPEAFLTRHSEALDQSAETWTTIAERANIASKPADVEAIWQSMQKANVPENTAGFIVHDLTPRDAARLASELGIFSLISARFHKEAGLTIGAGKAAKQITSYHNPFIDAVINDTYPGKTVVGYMMGLMSLLGEADKSATLVIKDLIDELEGDPLLAHRFTAGNLQPSADLTEFKRMVAVDWYHPEPSKSQLRNYFSDLKGRPEVFRDVFIDKVEADQQNRRLGLIRDMARFALVHQGVEPSDDIKAVLRETYQQWSSFEQIEKVFEEFVRENIANSQQAIAALAGNQQDPALKIRSHRTFQEVMEMSDVVTNIFFIKDRRITGSKRNSLPQPRDLQTEAPREEVKESEPQKKPLYIVKRLKNNNHELVEVGEDNMVDDLELDQFEPAIQTDIQAMINSLLENPLGAGTKNLKTRNSKANIRIGTNTLKLRRFSPLDRNTGRKSRDSLQIRIVYSITHGGVAIVDIIKHNKFDRAYQ